MIDPYTNKWKDVVRAYFKEAPLVPLLTSNTGEGVTVSASTENTTSQKAYHAFDNIDTTGWYSKYQSTCWLIVKFNQPKIATKFSILVVPGVNGTGTYKIQGSNDGSTFVDLLASFKYTSTLQTFEAVDKNPYMYYRVYITGATANDNAGVTPGVKTFQIYGTAA